MESTFEAKDWRSYLVSTDDPHRTIESQAQEARVISQALRALVAAHILPHATYDHQRMQAHRDAVRRCFAIPWTTLSPRMERLLYAINAISQPRVMVAVGIFCGNTLAANAGPAVGPGRVYRASRIVGIEIDPERADQARHNISSIDPDGHVEICVVDALSWLASFAGNIDLLYLDAGSRSQGTKSIYLDLLKSAEHALPPGSLVLAHNSVNSADQLSRYLARVRSPCLFRQSANMIVDDQGLEVSLR